MDAELARLQAHVDQTRSVMRGMVQNLPPADLARFIHVAASGQFDALDERERLLIGMLAVTAIFDFVENWPDDPV